MFKRLFVLFQYLIPQHFLSRCVGYLASCQAELVKIPFIKLFIRVFKVNMNEALRPEAKNYQSFNDFFTRELKPGVRSITPNPEHVLSPVDGGVSEIGHIEDGQILQAKGHKYRLNSLLAGNENLAKTFESGYFATLYLSPKDYHRIHMPTDGKLTHMWYVPGKLFSVNPATTKCLPGLFAKNERVICQFDTHNGPIVMVLVGAMIVASIETVWAGLVAPRRPKEIQSWEYTGEQAIHLKQGEEMGRFKLGSTVIMLYPDTYSLQWKPQLAPGSEVKLGLPLAQQSAVST